MFRMFRMFRMLLMLGLILVAGSRCWAGWFSQDIYTKFEVFNVAVGTTTPVQVFWSSGSYTNQGVNNLTAFALGFGTSANVTFSTTSVTGTRAWIIPKAASYDAPSYFSPDDPAILQSDGYLILDPAAGTGTKIIQIHRNTVR